MIKKTKIVCTIGPASKDVEVLKSMIKEGMNVARINFSHGGYEEQKEYVEAVKKAREELDIPVALMLDTQGPEVRLGKIAGDRAELIAGNEIMIVNEDIEGDSSKISVSYKDLYKKVQIRTRILLDDGKVELIVSKIEGENIICKINNGGIIKSRKSANIPETKLDLPALKEADIQDLKDGCLHGFDYISASFIRRADDVRQIREVLDQNGGKDIKIISKIENKEGLDNVHEIIDISDGVMVARGDLGVEMPLEEIPIIQKNMIKECNLKGKLVITATQMLESMTENPRPTRAEVSDVANAIFDGTGAIMLSGESSVGKYPVECVKTMTKIAKKVEENLDYWKRLDTENSYLDESKYEYDINRSICHTAKDMDSKGIIAYTISGQSPVTMASFLPKCPIFAITKSDIRYRQLSLAWNTIPVLVKDDIEVSEIISKAIEILKEMRYLNTGDLLAISGGTFMADNDKSTLNRSIGGVLKV